MTQNIGTSYQVSVPALSDIADITNAFKYYHQGGLTGSPATNSIEQYLININNRAQYIENAVGYTTYNPINNGTASPTATVNSRLIALESTVGTSLASTYVKTAPSSNSTAATSNVISPTLASVIPLQIKGIVGQSANLQEWQTSAATVAMVDSTGKLFSYDGTSTAEVATISGTQTFTNKTLLNPIQTIGTNAKTVSYTLVLSDQSKIIEINSSSATTLTIPAEATVNFPVGSYIVVLQIGTGQVTIAGTGFTPASTPGLKLRTQYSMATLIKRGTDLWIVAGDLTA